MSGNLVCSTDVVWRFDLSRQLQMLRACLRAATLLLASSDQTRPPPDAWIAREAIRHVTLSRMWWCRTMVNVVGVSRTARRYVTVSPQFTAEFVEKHQRIMLNRELDEPVTLLPDP